MTSFDDSTSLSAEERLSAVASILAAGILRLRSRGTLIEHAAESENPPDSAPACLDVYLKTVLSVNAG
jgi:hypothetical protein